MSKYQEISGAGAALDLPESATMEGIKSNYRKLIRKWHPDKCGEKTEACLEMTKRLTAAYETILSYCKNYGFSFAEAEVGKYVSGEEWWIRCFGDDPL